MFERFTHEARTVVIHAQQHAHRLGHRYIGGEHLLLALVATEPPAGAVLRELGATPDRVEEQIVRHVGLGAGAGVFAGLDADALAAIGIDLDAVRARIETAFGTEALSRAAQAAQCGRRRRLPGHAVHAVLRRVHRRSHRRRAASTPEPQPAPATGRYRATDVTSTGHLPFTPRAKKILEGSLREALARGDHHIGVEHVALALTAMRTGLVAQLLAELGAPAPVLRTAILDRYRQAG